MGWLPSRLFQGRFLEFGLDVGLVLLAVGSQFEVWLVSEAEHEWLLSPLALIAALAPIARRRAPFAAPLASLAALGAMSLVAERYVPASATTLMLVVISVWCMGAHNPPRIATGGLVATFGLVAIVVARDPAGDVGDAFVVSGLVVVAWVIGLGWYRRFKHTAALEERALRAEHERETAARIAVAEERARIARELHDIVAHSVSIMVLQAGAVRTRLTADQNDEREALLAVERTGREALTEMRRLLGAMRADREAAELAPQPGLGHLSELVAKVRASGLPVELRVEGEPVTLPAGVDLSAYRIVQEGLTNALKHAGPAHAQVVLRYEDDGVEVEVADDGRGGGTAGAAGHGLVGMRERVKLFGGDFEAGPRNGGGFAVRARLPVEAAGS
jgi:signal transduction histidine kinase